MNSVCMARAPVTLVLLVLIGVVFALMSLTGGSESIPNLIRFGALSTPHLARGEYWRLLTPLFIHIGVFHVLMNGYALWYLGSLCEFLFGGGVMLILFLLCGVGGTLASWKFGHGVISAGASGAIFGFAGVLVTAMWSGRTTLAPTARNGLIRAMLPFIGYNLVLGFLMPQIDNFGHWGGLVAGAACGLLLPRVRPTRVVQGYCALLGAVVIAWAGHAQWRIARGVDARAVESDVTFAVEMHNQMTHIVRRINGEHSVEELRMAADDIAKLHTTSWVHFVMPSLHERSLQLNRIFTDIQGDLHVLADRGDTARDAAADLERQLDHFFVWSDAFAQWAADYGFAITSQNGSDHAPEEKGTL